MLYTGYNWRRDRVAEGAPLLREYGPKAHRGFESHRLRQDVPPNQRLVWSACREVV